MARKHSNKHRSKARAQEIGGNAQLQNLKLAFKKSFDSARYQDALIISNKITDNYPDHFIGWELRADALARLHKLSDAVASAQRASELQSSSSSSSLKLAQYQMLAGDATHALPILIKLTKDYPSDPNIFSWLSQAYHALGKNDEALIANDKAMALDQENVEILVWRSRILDQLRKPSEAQEILIKIKKVAPKRVSISNHLGSLAMREGDYASAERYFNEELMLDDNSQVFSNLIIAKHYNPSYKAEELKEAVKLWARKYSFKNSVRAKTQRNPAKKIRLGLLSGGLRVHPVGQMILPALKNLNNKEFEIYVYSTNQVKDAISLQIEQNVSSWSIVEGLGNDDLESKLRHDEIDILIDMNGGGDGSRYHLLSREPAPLIVKWVGMLINTTGINAVDYLISDGIETPQGSDELYTEKLIRLPDDYICYQFPDYLPSVNSLPALMNRYLTFGCLNNPAKLSPPLIKEWSQLLLEVPNSKLLLRGIQFEGETFRQRISQLFISHGVSAERLIIEGPAKHQEFIATYHRIDIALDTWPYSGGLTTCEALAMGVPVVTCVGPTFAGRHSATHLANAGLPELVTDNWEDFRKRVKELAADLPSLAVIRAAMRTILKESPVCDGERFAKHFTKAMRGIWQRHCEDKPPEALIFNKEGDAWFADEDRPIELVEVGAAPEPEDAQFEWNLESPITVIDNGALFARHPKFSEWMTTGDFAVITFDPGSLLTKQADELKQLGEWHHYAHATLGDGNDATLYATLEPELTGILKPLSKQQTKAQDKFLQVVSELPISTVSLNTIKGLPSVDMLVLDDLNDVINILENGGDYIKSTLLIQARVSFQPTHEQQLNFTELMGWASQNGFRFYCFGFMKCRSHLPETLPDDQRQASELVGADVLLVSVHDFSVSQKIKLAFIFSKIFELKDIAYKLLAEVSESKSSDFLASTRVIAEENKCVFSSTDLQILDLRKLNANEYEKSIKDFSFYLENELCSQEKATDLLHKAEVFLKKDSGSVLAFYTLMMCIKAGAAFNAKIDKSIEARLREIGWEDKLSLFSYWVIGLIDNERGSKENFKISVVIVTQSFNEKVSRNIIELSRQTVDGEIIVISNDELPNHLSVHIDKMVLLKGNAGASHARNIGAALSSAPVLLFVDDDGYPHSDFVKSHLEAHQSYDVHSVRGMCAQTSMLSSPPHYNLGTKVFPYPVNLEGNASYRAEVFYKVGGWNDCIMYGHEGIELSYRLLNKYNAPEKQIYHPTPLLYHEYIKSESQGKEKKYKQHASHFLIIKDSPMYNKRVFDEFGAIKPSKFKEFKKSNSFKLNFNKD